MSTTTVIILGILVWVLLAIGLALLIGRMIRLRDRHPPHAPEARSESPDEDAGTYPGTQRDPHRHDDV